MATIREQIISRVVVAMTASGAPANLTVLRERMYPMEKGSMPLILIYAQDDMPIPTDKMHAHSPLTHRKLVLELECRNSGNPADAALDSVIQWVTTQMFVDEKFGDLANGVEEGPTKWNSKSGETPIASAMIQFTISYRTLRVDPSRRS
jgi:hypothetical protein